MVEGARRYLEVGHVQHVQGAIQASRIQVLCLNLSSMMRHRVCSCPLRMSGVPGAVDQGSRVNDGKFEGGAGVRLKQKQV